MTKEKILLMDINKTMISEIPRKDIKKINYSTEKDSFKLFKDGLGLKVIDTNSSNTSGIDSLGSGGKSLGDISNNRFNFDTLHK